MSRWTLGFIVGLALVLGVTLGWVLNEIVASDGLPRNSDPEALQRHLAEILMNPADADPNNLPDSDTLTALENRLKTYERRLAALRRAREASAGLEVQVQLIQAEPIRVTQSFLGRLETRVAHAIFTQAEGVLRNCQVEPGDFIEAGDSLCTIDRSARFGFRDDALVADAAGLVLEQVAEENQLIPALSPVFTVAREADLVLRLGLPEPDVVRLAQLENPMFSAKLLYGDAEAYPVSLRRVDPTADDATGLYQVLLNVSEKLVADWRAGLIRVDMFMDVELVTDTRDAVMIPERLVRNRPRIFVLDAEDVVQERIVDVGDFRQGDDIEIVSGLSDGDRLVIGWNRTITVGEQAFVNDDAPTTGADS